MLYIWDSPNVENNWIHLCNMCIVSQQVWNISWNKKSKSVSQKKKKSQPHLLNRSSLVMFLTCSLAPCSPSPVAASRTLSSELSSFLDKYVIFLETQQRVQNPKITIFNEECPCQNFHTMILSKLRWCLLPPNEAVWIITALKCKRKTLRRV